VMSRLTKSSSHNTIGDIFKLREHPKDFTTKLSSKGASGRANSPGYGKNVKYVTMGNPQPSPKSFLDMDAVHRLNGDGCTIPSMLKI
jgi:hypothetical protein